MNTIFLFTVSTLLFLAVSTILLYLAGFIKGFLYEEPEEVYSSYNAYYNHQLKAVSYLGYVEEVKNVNDIFKAIDKLTKQHKLPTAFGFVTELGAHHYIEITRLLDNTYDIQVHNAYTKNFILSTLRDPEYKAFMHKVTDEQNIFEILCDAYDTLISEVYWDLVGGRLQQEATGTPEEEI